MSGIKTLLDVYKQRGNGFINGLFNGYVIVNEQIDGSFFSAKFSGGEWKFFKKNGQISPVDRLLSMYYDPAIETLSVIQPEKTSTIPSDYLFCMEYVNNPDPDKKMLTITHIIQEGTGTYVHDKNILDRWADTLGVNRSPIIFEGSLSEDQKVKIMEFVYSSKDKLQSMFKSQSFSEYIVSMLNPEYVPAYGIAGVVFRFYEDKTDETQETYLAKIIDPAFLDMASANAEQEEKTNDYVYLIVIDLMNFIETYNLMELRKMIVPNVSFDENYIMLMNAIYKDFIDEFYGKYLDIDIVLPNFLQDKKFDMNIDAIIDDDVKKYVQISSTFKEIYRIVLNFFRRKKKKSVGIFNDSMMLQFNALVDKIKNVVIGSNVYERYFPNYYEFVGSISEEFDYLNVHNTRDGYLQSMSGRRVNMLIDPFQPVNNDHFRIINAMKKKNHLSTIIIVLDKDVSTAYPFSRVTVNRLLKKFRNENPEMVIDIIRVKDYDIETVLRAVYPMYIPVMWAAHPSRLKDYMLQLDFAKKKKVRYNFDKKFKLTEMPSDVDRGRLLDYIRSENFQAFKDCTPVSIHPEFFNLKSEIA